MRRAEREMQDEQEISQLLNRGKILRLAIPDPSSIAPYLVPVNYGYTWEEGQLTLFFHSASAGRKYELLKNGAIVGFELDAGYLLREGATACSYSCRFESIIGTGSVRLLTAEEERLGAIRCLMRCLCGKEPPVEERALSKTAVFAVDALEWAAKRNE